VAAVYLIFQVGSVLAGPLAGFWAALLMAVSVFQVAFSQEARMYALLAAFSLLANYSFLRVLRDHRRSDFTLYVVSAVLLTYTHLFGWLIVAMQNVFVGLVFVLFNRRRRDRTQFLSGWLICQLIVVLAFAPWAIEMLRDPRVNGIDWIPAPRISMLLSTFKQFASGSLYLGPVLALLSIAGILTLNSGSGQGADREVGIWLSGRERALFLLLWLLVPITLASGASVSLRPVYQTRYLIGASAALYLMAAIGLTRLRNRVLLLGAVAMLVLMWSNDLREYFQGTRLVAGLERENWRQAAADIDARAQTDSLVVLKAQVLM
jgi:uncharacterized membrane protein